MDSQDAQETSVEAMTAGLVILIFAAHLFGFMPVHIAMTLGGLVLIGSGLYQSRKGWHVSVTTWLLGIVLLFGGIGVRVFLVAFMEINWVAISLALIGGYMIWRNFMRRR